ncbi:MAG TPA: HPr kinase/phosphatase C-terminal domain-containing protein [Xanthobacteraceae bacterium]|nr:HPr kinase/phosphatase C-terminal domain-containing protein [Xanthobacteraceae bacterium]
MHASCVLVGARALLIRGPSASGKSQLALELIHAADTGGLRFARLVADDRVHLTAAGGRLLARPAESLAGLIEVRGTGLLRLPYEPCAVIGLVVDLGEDSNRLPAPEQRQALIDGISLPRLAVASGVGPLPAVMALLTSPKDGWL